MLILDATNKTITAVLGGAAATTQPKIISSWADDNGSGLVEGASTVSTNSTTPVTAIAAPASSTRRVIKEIYVYNADTAPVDVTLTYDNNGTGYIVAQMTLAVGQTWSLSDSISNSGAAGANAALSNLAGVAINAALLPGSDDTIALGSVAKNWSDLFLGNAATINFNNSNVVLTHSSGILTMGTGELRITTPGTNSASVPTLGSTSTLTNKTLTAPVIATIVNSGTLTLPTSTDTLVGRATTDTLTNKTIASASYTGPQQLAEGAGIRLDAALSADGTFSGTTIAGTAGATLAFGDLIYLAVADSRWELVDADSVTTAGAVLTGMCVLAAAADGDPTVVLLDGNIRADANFPTLTVGAPVYASTTPGDIQVAQPNGTDDVIQVVGFALTADSIIFRPSFDYITHV